VTCPTCDHTLPNICQSCGNEEATVCLSCLEDPDTMREWLGPGPWAGDSRAEQTTE